jgi:hypothetical protein
LVAEEKSAVDDPEAAEALELSAMKSEHSKLYLTLLITL